MAMDFEKPAIIQRAQIREVQFGLSYGVSRVSYDRFVLPRDYREAKLAELIAWLPAEMRDMPAWALLGMIVPGMGSLIHVSTAAGGGGALIKTTTFITSTSVSNQDHTVRDDWNSSDNRVDLISDGGNAADGWVDDETDTWGGGGGGGGFARKANVTLTPSGTTPYRLRAGGAGAGTGEACWFGGVSLAVSSVGIQGGGNGSTLVPGTGASTTSAIGDTKRAGGDANVGGGGAAGSTGVGGNAPAGTGGGTGDGATTAANTAGTQYDASHGSGGGANAPASSVAGSNGPLYGGGASGGKGDGSAGGTGAQGLIIITNNVSL